MTMIAQPERQRPGLYGRIWLEAYRRVDRPPAEQIGAAELNRLALVNQEVAEAEEEAIMSQLLRDDPLPRETIDRVEKAASHHRKAREVATAHLLEMFAEQPHTSRRRLLTR